jgi:signal peptide peptidase-like protein 2B
MVEVATGGGSESNERLPLLIMIPQLRTLRSVCSVRGYSLLGFGDIIIPGLLVCFANAFDVARGYARKPYFITAMLGKS